jgi:L-malate glycosyltransferase
MSRNSNIRIMVLPSWYPPRGGEFFREHSLALAAEGLDVTTMAVIPSSIRKHGLKNFITGQDIPKSSGNQERLHPDHSVKFTSNTEPSHVYNKANIVGWIRNAVSLAEQWIRQHGKPDLMQVHSSIWAGVAAARIKKRYGIPYVITEHRSRFVFNTPEAQEMFLTWHLPLLYEAFTNASRIVTVSDSLQPKILDIAGSAIHHTPITIPNMVDTRYFSPSTTSKSEGSFRLFSTSTSKPDTPFRFFCLAHLEPVKGIDTLIDAMKLLLDDNSIYCQLVIGGDGSQRHLLEEQVSRLGLQQHISFTGALSREEVREQLHRANAFVLPSRFEAFGVVFIEAMACGLPVIAGRSGGPESFITDDCGYIVEPDKPQELARAMKSMKHNYHSFNRDTIWNYAINRFSPKAIATEYVTLYKEISMIGST